MENKQTLSLADYRELATDPASSPQLKEAVRKKRIEILEAREKILESRP